MAEQKGTALLEPEVSKPKLPEPPKVVEPPAAKAAMCEASDRAPAGFKRFKVRGETPGGNQPTRYVLARSEADARAEYTRAMHLDKDKGEVRLVVATMPD